MNAERVYVFKRFERLRHWLQAALIATLAVTGFEIHGSYGLLGYETAQETHTTTAWLLIGLWLFAFFWNIVSGEWRRYVPLAHKLPAMLRYNVTGIFGDAPHPFRRATPSGQNPLQRLAYLIVRLVAYPVILISGLLYLYYSAWPAVGLDGLSLAGVAFAHTAAAFLMLVFFVIHVYLTTTGHTPMSHIRAMITGYEELETS